MEMMTMAANYIVLAMIIHKQSLDLLLFPYSYYNYF
jgi:hypothetical protein